MNEIRSSSPSLSLSSLDDFLNFSINPCSSPPAPLRPNALFDPPTCSRQELKTTRNPPDAARPLSGALRGAPARATCPLQRACGASNKAKSTSPTFDLVFDAHPLDLSRRQHQGRQPRLVEEGRGVVPPPPPPRTPRPPAVSGLRGRRSRGATREGSGARRRSRRATSPRLHLSLLAPSSSSSSSSSSIFFGGGEKKNPPPPLLLPRRSSSRFPRPSRTSRRRRRWRKLWLARAAAAELGGGGRRRGSKRFSSSSSSSSLKTSSRAPPAPRRRRSPPPPSESSCSATAAPPCARPRTESSSRPPRSWPRRTGAAAGRRSRPPPPSFAAGAAPGADVPFSEGQRRRDGLRRGPRGGGGVEGREGQVPGAGPGGGGVGAWEGWALVRDIFAPLFFFPFL